MTGLSQISVVAELLTFGEEIAAPVIEKRLRQFRRPSCGSVRIDET
ncbi:hypothetical protein ABID20_003924 [Rhizobium alvei]